MLSRISTTIGHTGRRPSARRGAYAVEFALTVPVLFVFTWATFEFQRGYQIRHALNEAAYEAARIGICPGAVAANVITTANTMLTNFSIQKATVTIQPSTISDTTTSVTVNISCKFSDNNWFTPIYLGSTVFQTSVTMQHENALFASQAP